MRMLPLMLPLAFLAMPGSRMVLAQDSTLDALLAEADASNPRLLSVRSMARAAEARIPQAGALPDPMVGLTFMNVPVASPTLGSDQMMTMTQLQVGSMVPWPGKLGLREEAARFRAEATDWDVEGVRNEVRADVRSAYYRVYFVDRALEVTQQNRALLEDLLELTRTLYGVGTGAQSEVLRAQVELAQLTDQEITLREQRVRAVAGLNALLGRPAETALATTRFPDDVRAAALAESSGGLRFSSTALSGLVPSGDSGPLPEVSELTALALESSPVLRAQRARTHAQSQALDLARTARLPDLNLSAAYSIRADRADLFSLMVSAPVPIFSGRKQDQAVIEQEAIVAEQDARHDALAVELGAEVASLAAGLHRIRDQLALLRDGILPQARAGLSSSTASYRVGRVDFLSLLDAQATLYRHELDFHRLLTDFATNLAALERAVGTEVLR